MIRGSWRAVWIAIATALLVLPASADDIDEPVPFEVPGLAPAPADLDPRAIADRVEETLRGQSVFIEAAMTVVSPRLPTPRVVKFRSWDDRGGKRSFIRILAPAKDKGTGFLKLHPNLWTYIPRVERTMRIPPSMMLQSWMGSDFSNDDLVRESSQLDDYEHYILGIDEKVESASQGKAYVVDYVPNEDAPVVWGRIITWIDHDVPTPLRQDFYDEDGVHLRTMTFTDARVVDGRHYPHRWSMRPLDKEGHETIIEIEMVRFNQDFDETIFTTRNLKRRD